MHGTLDTVREDDMVMLAFGEAAPKGYRSGPVCESTHVAVAVRIGSAADRLNLSAVQFDALINEPKRNAPCPA